MLSSKLIGDKNMGTNGLTLLDTGYIEIGKLNALCYMLGKLYRTISENVEVYDMGKTFIIANKKLDKSVEIVKDDWVLALAENGSTIIKVKQKSIYGLAVNKNAPTLFLNESFSRPVAVPTA